MSKKKMSEEERKSIEFRSKEVSVGEVIDASADVIANLVSEKLLSPLDVVRMPAIIIHILKKAVDNKKEDSENGTEED